MKYSAIAVVAFALAAAAAGSAGAQSMATPGPTPSFWHDALPGIGPMTTMVNVQDAQQQLRRLGLYGGPIDGRMNAATRAAILAFQQRYRLPETATLDRTTFAWLTNSYTPGYGSSAPPVETAPMTSPGNPQAPLGAGGMTTGGAMMAR
jgi:peptidoglycan hydrolase-like protein with peptidoglycan-binding domain